MIFNKVGLSALLLITSMIIASSTVFAYDRHVTVSNESSKNIIEFYGSNMGTGEWQEDILGVDILASGEEADINFDDATGYCKFDFKVVFDDDSEIVEDGFNVCDLGTFTVTDSFQEKSLNCDL